MRISGFRHLAVFIPLYESDLRPVSVSHCPFRGGLGLLYLGPTCGLYLDNKNCMSALVRGDSNTEGITALLARVWQLAHLYDICS